jgi:kynurenine formamidase
MAIDVEGEYNAWVQTVGERRRFGHRDRLGTAHYIDAAARQRAVDAMRTGTTVSLARPLGISASQDLMLGWVSVDVVQRESTASAQGIPYPNGPVNGAFDVLHAAAHGSRQTHLDGLNHAGFRGEWYSGFPVDDPDGPCVADLAGHHLFTRGVVVDIPALRGTDWVDENAPVTDDDIDACLSAVGVTFESGDALLLYMGRDRFEAAGREMSHFTGQPMPGAGASAARWFVEHEVSLLCWDFLDAIHPSEPRRQVHSLIWATGLLLVDNCNLAPAASLARETGVSTGGLVVAPPPLPKATGSLVDPLFIQ